MFWKEKAHLLYGAHNRLIALSPIPPSKINSKLAGSTLDIPKIMRWNASGFLAYSSIYDPWEHDKVH